jgi:hypothetical protein
MVVVVETPRAVRSPWVQLEVSTVVSRRLGLAAVHLKGGPRIREIDELSRCRIDNDIRSEPTQAAFALISAAIGTLSRCVLVRRTCTGSGWHMNVQRTPWRPS